MEFSEAARTLCNLLITCCICAMTFRLVIPNKESKQLRKTMQNVDEEYKQLNKLYKALMNNLESLKKEIIELKKKGAE